MYVCVVCVCVVCVCVCVCVYVCSMCVYVCVDVCISIQIISLYRSLFRITVIKRVVFIIVGNSINQHLPHEVNPTYKNTQHTRIEAPDVVLKTGQKA